MIRSIKAIPILILIMTNICFSQLKQPEFQIKKDTLQVVHKEILLSESYKRERINWDLNNTIGTIVALTFGYLTYHYNEKADTYYSKYKKTGNIDLMNKYWDKTKKYDQMKGLCYIGFEVGFTINIWSFYKKNK